MTDNIIDEFVDIEFPTFIESRGEDPAHLSYLESLNNPVTVMDCEGGIVAIAPRKIALLIVDLLNKEDDKFETGIWDHKQNRLVRHRKKE